MAIPSDMQPRGADPRLGVVATEIGSHHAGDDRESRARATILRQLDELDRPFDRHAASTHVTASAIVIGRRGTVLHRHRRLHRWLQPGGHLDPGELPCDAARREGEEETGLALAHPSGGPVLVHVDVHDSASGHRHLDFRYLLVGPDVDPSPPPGESQDVAWFGWDEATSLADDALAGALRSTRRLIAAGAVRVPGGMVEETDG